MTKRMKKFIHQEHISTFPFEKMANVMKAINWKWTRFNSPPTDKQLRERAEYLLSQCLKDASKMCATGGLVAFRDGQIAFDPISKPADRLRELWNQGESV